MLGDSEAGGGADDVAVAVEEAGDRLRVDWEGSGEANDWLPRKSIDLAQRHLLHNCFSATSMTQS